MMKSSQPADLKGKLEHQSASRDYYLIVHRLPRSGVAESFRNIRTKLLFSSPDRELKTILVTSTHPGEGKSFSAVSLGIVMAQTGKRVLLVDADKRRPSLGRIFSLGSPAENMGLSSLVMRRVPAESAIFKTGIENLSVLPAGPKPPNPSELLGSQSMKETLEKLRSEFDMLIIDTPPVLGIPDTLSLASMVDGCLLVIRYAKTSYKGVLNVKESIRMVKGRILGVILNRVKPEPFGYYYGGYHGYYYHKYYEGEGQSKPSEV